MEILNLDIDVYTHVEKWMDCPHKKIVINKGLESCDLTEEGLKRYADIKGVSVDFLITQLEMKCWANRYVVHHSELQCDPDFITLIENNRREFIFSNEDYRPVIIDLSKHESIDKFIVVYEEVEYDGATDYRESLYEYNAYMDRKSKLDALYTEIYNLRYSLKEVR